MRLTDGGWRIFFRLNVEEKYFDLFILWDQYLFWALNLEIVPNEKAFNFTCWGQCLNFTLKTNIIFVYKLF